MPIYRLIYQGFGAIHCLEQQQISFRHVAHYMVVKLFTKANIFLYIANATVKRGYYLSHIFWSSEHQDYLVDTARCVFLRKAAGCENRFLIVLYNLFAKHAAPTKN